MNNENIVAIPKVTVEEFVNAPQSIELICRTGFENIKGQENVEGKADYVHIKLGKSFVTYKIVGAHNNDRGQVSISARKIKASVEVAGNDAAPEVDEKEEEKAEIRADIEALNARLAELE